MAFIDSYKYIWQKIILVWKRQFFVVDDHLPAWSHKSSRVESARVLVWFLEQRCGGQSAELDVPDTGGGRAALRGSFRDWECVSLRCRAECEGRGGPEQRGAVVARAARRRVGLSPVSLGSPGHSLCFLGGSTELSSLSERESCKAIVLYLVEDIESGTGDRPSLFTVLTPLYHGSFSVNKNAEKFGPLGAPSKPINRVRRGQWI